jgi:lambda repressor-like predicted transcriptional regulator
LGPNLWRKHWLESTPASPTDDLRRYAAEAKRAGVSMSQIARDAGLSRQGLYDLLAERPS